MEKSKEIKLMILENFIDHFTSNEEERERMKNTASNYVDEDHVNELSEYFPSKEEIEIENAKRFLCNDVEEIPSILDKLGELDDTSVNLAGSIEGILVWDKINYLTVDAFFEQIEA